MKCSGGGMRMRFGEMCEEALGVLRVGERMYASNQEHLEIYFFLLHCRQLMTLMTSQNWLT